MENIAHLSLPPVSVESAPQGARKILESSLAQMGRIPNLYANLANSGGLLTTYRHGYDAFRLSSGFSKTEQEVIFLAISRFHKCTYCVAVHSALADMNKVPAEVTNAIRDGRSIEDPKLEELRSFTTIMVASRGLPNPQDLRTFLAAGFMESQVLEIILAIAVKTISNYSNHLFGTQLDSQFSAREWHP